MQELMYWCTFDCQTSRYGFEKFNDSITACTVAATSAG